MGRWVKKRKPKIVRNVSYRKKQSRRPVDWIHIDWKTFNNWNYKKYLIFLKSPNTKKKEINNPGNREKETPAKKY